ncbi:MAG TPA: formyltransferase family protein [Patescibacteria group bacterium]|nr:formyltransferase family protein [Patescibacteria group bacterium]
MYNNDVVLLRQTKHKTLRLAVLISDKGQGSTLQAIIQAIEQKMLDATIVLVISDKPGAKGLERAKKQGITTFLHELYDKTSSSKREKYSKVLASLLNKKNIQIAVLAGFSTILAPSFLTTFKGKTLNIHPGLIPDRKDEQIRFPDGTIAPWNKGLMTEKAVERFLNLSYSGSTIHLVTEDADFGPVLQRVFENVNKNDTVETLYERLKAREHEGIILALQDLAKKE